ncbi:MAG: polysaccharide biosynthesis tyrosine autokinase [Flavobacteriales bacterium]
MLNDETSQRSLNFESYKERITNFSNEFELGLFLFIVRRSLLWIALFMLTALATSVLYLRYTASIYESRSLLQLRERNTAQQVLSMNTFGEDKNLQADVELMRSKFFLSKVLKRMPLEVSYFNKGQILTEEFYTRSFFKLRDVSVIDKAIYDQPIMVDLSKPDLVGISYVLGGRDHEKSFARGEFVRTPHFTGILDISATAVASDVDNRMVLYLTINSPESLLLKYSKLLQVRIADPNAKTVEITCQDENNLLARDLAQIAAEAFIDYDVDRQIESAESIIKFIRSQKDTVFEQLREMEYQLQSVKMENKIADLDQLTPIYLERRTLYEDEMVKHSMDIELLSEIEKATNKPVPEVNAHDLMPLLIGTPFEQNLMGMITTLQHLIMEREAMRYDATDAHQHMRSLDMQIDTQKRMLLSTVHIIRQRSIDRKEELSNYLSEFEQEFLQLPEKELQYVRIARVFNINEKYYTQLLEKDIEYRISKAGSVSENRILENSSASVVPLSPKRNMVYATYLASGFLVSLLFVLIRYILHDNITSLHDIAKLSNASIGILGMVPKYKKDIPISQLLIDKNPKSLIAEAFRSIRTNLQFVDNSPGAKLIAITSTISGEGKTFVAINLAGIISYSGKRVIILDLDMRKPKIHLGFGVENLQGMSTLLIGKHDLETCVRKSELEGLHFITAGPIPPNPSELIISKPMDDLLEVLRGMYDVVLIDNPPVGLVTDGIPMIQRADYPIYIFRSDYSKKQFVQNVDRLINENNITRLSTILNGVDIDRNKYGYNYGYGYGYGYGQGYGGGYYEEHSNTSGGWFSWMKRKG